MPERELIDDLRVERDGELDDEENVCSASNRQLRLYVASWMLEPSCGDFRAALREALTLYEYSGRNLLDAPGRLTTQGIALEVRRLVGVSPEGDGR